VRGAEHRDREHKRTTHDRWASNLREAEWRYEQCGRCIWWVPLTGTWGEDWGVCSNPASPHDRSAMFEHDGCDVFEEADEWVVPAE
jgi:hypothetical protein